MSLQNLKGNEGFGRVLFRFETPRWLITSANGF